MRTWQGLSHTAPSGSQYLTQARAAAGTQSERARGTSKAAEEQKGG